VVRTALRTVAAIYLAYVAITVLILLPAANFLAPWFVQDQYGRELRTDIILFNPFSLEAQVRNASLLELDGSPFASLDRASINLSLASLLDKGLVLDEVLVEELRVHARHWGNGEFNFSDLLQSDDGVSPEEPAADGEIPALTIRRLAFSAERIQLTDEAREEPFSTHYDGIDIVVTDLTTIQEDGKPYRIAAVAESGGALQWEGTVSIPGANSEGSLSISDLSLRTFWRFARPWLNFELVDGTMSVQGDYRISWAEAFSYHVSKGSITVDTINLQPADPATLADTGFGLGQISISGIELNGDKQHVDVASITVDDANISGWSEGEQVSLADLFAVELPAAEETAPSSDEDGAPWTARVADIQLANAGIRWRSEFTDPPQIQLSPISARVQSVNWPLAGVSPVNLAFTLNSETQFDVDANLVLGAGTGDLKYQLSALSLPMFNPNLPSALKATLSSGQLDVAGELTMADYLPVEVTADGSITNFSGTMEGGEEALTRWDSVRWQQLRVNLSERTAYMEKLLIHDYEGRVHIAEDGSVNASNVWQEEVGERAEEIVEDLDLNKPWQVKVPEIFVSDSAIDFKDESLPIPFRTIIGDVNGEVLNVSSEPGVRTEVDIKGSVDGYAPVVLAGWATPLSTPPALDLDLSFTGVDMVLLTPYSGTYAGYAIERGLLSLDLTYGLENDQLQGKNNVLIEQLKLGDKVDSDKAVDLPLELALALLTDVNGVIDLKVPVEGDVNDPEFAIGGVLASAFVNLITKAVTAPFNLLASLVGSEDDLQRIPFSAGNADLNEPAMARLEQLNQALQQRPGLTLVVSGRLNLESDRERLQRQTLEEQLLAEGIQQDDITRRGPDYMNAVVKRYQALTGDTSTEVTFSEQLNAVRGSITISNEQLLALAQARAVATKEHLVNELGLGADRAVINQAAQLVPEDNTYSGVELELDS
jgi:Domain of Unknown Function (DUF748)